jgi:hypothetical protein
LNFLYINAEKPLESTKFFFYISIKEQYMSFLTSKFGPMLLAAGVSFFVQSAMIKPNPIISRGTAVTVKASSGDVTGLNDHKFGKYDTKKWVVSPNSWVALTLVSGPAKIFFTFNCPDTSWSDSIGLAADSCKKTVQYPVDYDILTSSNSTTGADGDWTKAVSITGNMVAARGHLIDFTGATWVKMAIAVGKGSIDEIEVFDASNGAEDTWFFLGTKFSSLMFKGAKASGLPQDKSPPDSDFASMVTLRDPTFTPAMIRGGINCGVHSGDVARDISKYLTVVGNVHFWAIELGRYDSWGGKNDSVAEFTKNLQIIIDSCKVHSIQPVIATIPATTKGSKAATPTAWQVHNDFLKAIDSVIKKNKLIPGADLYYYFTHGPSNMGYYDLDASGILPNDYGDFEAQREWSKKMDSAVYKAPPVAITTPHASISSVSSLSVKSLGGRLTLSTSGPGTATFFATNGRIIDKVSILKSGTVTTRIGTLGSYLVKFTSAEGTFAKRIVNY